MFRLLAKVLLIVLPTSLLADGTARDAQGMLSRLGYQISVDGNWGPQSQRVISQFYTDRGLTYDGTLSENEFEDLSAAIEAAEQMLEEGAAADAAETFAAILQEESANAAAYGGLVRAYLAMKDIDQAEAILNGAPAEIATTAEVEAARAALALARKAEKAGPVDALRAKLEANPADHQARFDLATALHASGKVEEAVNELLDLFRRDREWNDGAAKAQLFEIFNSLKATDPVALNGRRKLSSMIFA
jgi:putative thioredoxin